MTRFLVFSGCCTEPSRRQPASRALRSIPLGLCLAVGQVMAAGSQIQSQAALVASAQPLAETESRSMEISVDGNALTVRLRSAPLVDVLKEIGRRADLGVTFHEAFPDRVSMEFRRVPLTVGLHKLLDGYAWVLVYGDSRSVQGRSVEKVIVLSRARGATGAAPPSHEARTRMLARTVAARLGNEEVKTALETHMYAPEARQRRDAFLDLISAVDIEDFDILIGMLRDEDVQMSAWNEILAPISDVMSWRDQVYVRVALRRQSERMRFAEMLESYRRFKAREVPGFE